MRKTINAEAHILDRIMYLLEENSVNSLARADANFGKFVEQLYQTLEQKSQHLHQTV